MLFGSNTLFIEGGQIWGSLKMSSRGQKENVSNKVHSPPIRDFLNERYQDIQCKSFKI